MINCPYCDIEIKMSEVDAHDGCCPECGAYISGISSFEDDDFGGTFDDEFDDDDEFDEFDDDDDGDDDDFDDVEDKEDY